MITIYDLRVNHTLCDTNTAHCFYSRSVVKLTKSDYKNLKDTGELAFFPKILVLSLLYLFLLRITLRILKPSLSFKKSTDSSGKFDDKLKTMECPRKNIISN